MPSILPSHPVPPELLLCVSSFLQRPPAGGGAGGRRGRQRSTVHPVPGGAQGDGLIRIRLCDVVTLLLIQRPNASMGLRLAVALLSGTYPCDTSRVCAQHKPRSPPLAWSGVRAVGLSAGRQATGGRQVGLAGLWRWWTVWTVCGPCQRSRAFACPVPSLGPGTPAG